MPTMSSKIKTIADLDLCIACGACVEACPSDNIQPIFDQYNAAPSVQLLDIDKCNFCPGSICETVCPSIETDFRRLRSSFNPEDASDSLAGPDSWLKDILLMRSEKFGNDGRSSSGGVVKEFVTACLEKELDVICLQDTPIGGISRNQSVSDFSDIDQIPGSLYQSSSTFDVIEKVRTSSRNVCLIAIPCQLAGILSYFQKCDPELVHKIQVKIGIICGWMYSHHSIRASEQFNRISERVERASFRGEDRVGFLKLFSRDRTYKFKRRQFVGVKEALNYLSSFSSDFNRLRCRTCMDHTNLLADVVVGDAWLRHKQNEKISIVGVRTSRGAELTDNIKNREGIFCEKSRFGDLQESQGDDIIFNRTAGAIKNSLNGASEGILNFKGVQGNNAKDARPVLYWLGEKYRRRLVRNGQYSVYRALYSVRKWRSLLKVFVWGQIQIFKRKS